MHNLGVMSDGDAHWDVDLSGRREGRSTGKPPTFFFFSTLNFFLLAFFRFLSLYVL